MILCITEKPSVARDIAQILGASHRHDGYFEGKGYCITWTFGHLCCLKEPQDYTDKWKYWTLSTLPMIPERFGIKLIKDKGIEKQFRIIKDLVGKAEEVINCGDAGQEGELIQRWVLQKARVKCPVKRLWISSLTDDAIRAGFNNLKSEADYKNLYEAGLSRAIGDWLLGLNSTRLYTLKYGGSGSTLSVGRVQTPTLALIVERFRQIQNFIPEDYWELKTVYRNVLFNAVKGKYTDLEKAKEVLDGLKETDFEIVNIESKKGRESAPRLFDLTSLQVECNKLWGWTADETLRLIQSLYEKKVTTYPRVDTTYLPDDLYPKIDSILKHMTPYADITAPLLEKPLRKSKKVFDNAKVTDHHAIIPTGESPSRLVGDERKMYHLIARRFIAAFYPDCEFNTTTVYGEASKLGFKATGKAIINPGWHTIYANDTQNAANEESTPGENDSESLLPVFSIHEKGSHSPKLVKKTTQPPKPYTEGTLLRAMEGAGKTVDDEELREALKENGIGRPSTRSAIIETLFRRKYISREKKNIMPTKAGIELIDAIKTDLLKSAKLTGLWENKLRRIEKGTYSAKEFVDEIKSLLNEVITSVLTDRTTQRIEAHQESEKPKVKNGKPKKPATKSGKDRGGTTGLKQPSSLSEILCPQCQQGHIIKGRTGIGCSAYKNGCKFVVVFEKLGKQINAENVTTAIVQKYLHRTFKKE